MGLTEDGRTNYKGPGQYRHYKGGTYTILGLGQHESTESKFVVYLSHSIEHEDERRSRGVDYILRPLNREDGPDAFNEMVRVAPDDPAVPRFEKVK